MPNVPVNTAPRPALVSIHDVMPETLAAVVAASKRCQAIGIHPMTLLVVPGLAWTPTELATLKALTNDGYVLAGHGWQHHVDRIRGWRHRLHSRLLSRNVAEHLALDRIGIERLLYQCFAWFDDKHLPQPSLYVPPAWAMGSIPRSTLQTIPFRWYEYLHGVYDSAHDRWHRLGVLGFEADVIWRKPLLRAANAFSAWISGHAPLRISIHPHDFELFMAKQLQRWLSRPLHCMNYDDLL